MFEVVADVTQRMKKIVTLTNTTANFSESIWSFYLKLTAMPLQISKKGKTKEEDDTQWVREVYTPW